MVLPEFKMASRTPDKLAAAKADLNALFDVVKGSNNKLNPKGVKKIEDDRYEIAELIVSVIEDTVTTQDPTPFLVETVSAELGDELLWQELDATVRVVNRSYGTKPLSQRLYFKEWGITTTMKEVAVEIPLEHIAVGRITASMVTDAIADAIIRHRIGNILDGIDAGVTSGADRSGVAGYTLRYASFTQDNLDKAIDGLLDEGEVPTIFGRHIALAPTIRSFTGFSSDQTVWSPMSSEELEKRSLIGTYHGAGIVALRDPYHKAAGDHVIRSDRLYLASATKGAKFMTRDVAFLNWAMVDPRTSTFGMGTRIEDGLLVHDPYKYRIIEVA